MGFVPGDGTVVDARQSIDGFHSLFSLNLCTQWKSQQKETVNVVTIPKMVHGSAVDDPIALKVLIDTLFQ